MIRGNEIEPQIYEAGHIQQVLEEIKKNFKSYFDGFLGKNPEALFLDEIERYQREQEKYRSYMDPEALDEFDEFDPGEFKGHTKKNCPIIQRCLMSQDEVMRAYKIAFSNTTGRQLLDAVRNISMFGAEYVSQFEDSIHESSTYYDQLRLELLNEKTMGTGGVIGYGVQSSLLYGLYPREFAHRSQNAVWALYFLSGRKDFGLMDGSEFLMVHQNEGTCEQNYFYPAELFGFYSLQLYLLFKEACAQLGITLENRYRYIYLSVFSDHVASVHRSDINTYVRSSTYVESQPWFG